MSRIFAQTAGVARHALRRRPWLHGTVMKLMEPEDTAEESFSSCEGPTRDGPEQTHGTQGALISSDDTSILDPYSVPQTSGTYDIQD